MEACTGRHMTFQNMCLHVENTTHPPIREAATKYGTITCSQKLLSCSVQGPLDYFDSEIDKDRCLFIEVCILLRREIRLCTPHVSSTALSSSHVGFQNQCLHVENTTHPPTREAAAKRDTFACSRGLLSCSVQGRLDYFDFEIDKDRWLPLHRSMHMSRNRVVHPAGAPSTFTEAHSGCIYLQ